MMLCEINPRVYDKYLRLSTVLQDKIADFFKGFLFRHIGGNCYRYIDLQHNSFLKVLLKTFFMSFEILKRANC